MIVIVTGARDWDNALSIEREIKKHKEEIDWLIQGGAPGADNCADEVCKNLTIPCITVDAHWHKLKRAAGPIRNRWMIDLAIRLAQSYADDEAVSIPKVLVLAFHPDLKKSRGTANMILQCEKAGFKIKHIKR